jgi:hypothetical protein
MRDQQQRTRAGFDQTQKMMPLPLPPVLQTIPSPGAQTLLAPTVNHIPLAWLLKISMQTRTIHTNTSLFQPTLLSPQLPPHPWPPPASHHPLKYSPTCSRQVTPHQPTSPQSSLLSQPLLRSHKSTTTPHPPSRTHSPSFSLCFSPPALQPHPPSLHPRSRIPRPHG